MYFKYFDVVGIQIDMEIQQKQRYLRENILEKQYDAQEFMDFCESTRGSINIQTWTLDELKEIVQKFISSNSKTLQLSPFQYQAVSPNNQKVQSFDWDTAFQPPQQPQPNNFNLNTFDMDFLETMGMSTKPSQKVQKIENKAKVQQVTVKSLTTDPKAILAKLNNKEGEFISAYNAAALSSRQKSKLPDKIKDVKQQKEKDLSPTYTKTQKTVQIQPQKVLVMSLKENVIIEDNFKATIKCRSFSNKPKLDGDYEVTVTGHQVINPNIFVPNFVLYTVSTSPLGKQVKRRLKDFEMLRGLLKKIFPSTQIPHLQRYSRLSQTEPNVIKKQKLFIQSFLNSLLMNKAIRCKIIDDFLLCDSLDTLKKIFHEYQKLEKPKSIEQIYTPEGKAELEYSAQSKRFVSQQQLYFDYLQPNLNKLKDLYDQLLLNFASSVSIIQQISNLYDNLRDSTHNVNGSLPQNHRTVSLETAFDKISDLHKHWALSIKTQAKVVEVEVRHLYRFEVDNIETIREICKFNDNIVEAYAKRTDKDQAARQTYEFNKKLNDFKTGVDVPSKNTTVLKYQAAYFLQHTVSEIQRYLSELSDKLIKKFDLFSGMQLNITKDLESNWREFSSFAQK